GGGGGWGRCYAGPNEAEVGSDAEGVARRGVGDRSPDRSTAIWPLRGDHRSRRSLSFDADVRSARESTVRPDSRIPDDSRRGHLALAEAEPKQAVDQTVSQPNPTSVSPHGRSRGRRWALSPIRASIRAVLEAL